jgi:hypothetical protein
VTVQHFQRVVQGVVSFELEAKENATVVKLSHRAIGEVNEKTQTGYASGWQDLLGTRLKAFVERGVLGKTRAAYSASSGFLCAMFWLALDISPNLGGCRRLFSNGWMLLTDSRGGIL